MTTETVRIEAKELTLDLLRDVSERIVPMLRLVAEEYRDRVPSGYPNVVDTVDRGVVGLELDPSHSVYIVTDGQQLFAEMYYRSPRNDARSSASREKFSGMPFDDRRPLGATLTDQQLRNLIAELMSRWNYQPGIIYITDT